jgi:hypothetical protein
MFLQYGHNEGDVVAENVAQGPIVINGLIVQYVTDIVKGLLDLQHHRA